jgi:hypothetical protein
VADLRAYARDAAIRNGIDPTHFERQIDQESGFDPDAYNETSGAAGIAQIVVRWHPTMAGKTGDPLASLDYAAGLMRSHLAVNRGDWALALSYYNAGPGATAKGLAGTLDGWPYAETVRYVSNILRIPEAESRRRLTGGKPVAPRVTFNRDFPATIQDDDWSCAPSSLDWALRSLGRSPGHSYVENLLLKDGIVSREQGLLVGTGEPLAAWIGKKVPAEVYYGADGFSGNNEPAVTFQAIADEIGPYPLLIGGHNWGGPNKGHWSGVRGYDRARDVLLLANPAGSGPVFGGQEMTRQQFLQRGPFSMVRVLHNDLLAPAPVPPPPSPSIRDRLLRVRAEIDELLAAVPA